MTNQKNPILKISLVFTLLVIYSLGMIGSVHALTINSVSTSPGQVEPGKSVTLNINLKNNDDTTVKDITVALVLVNPNLSVPFSPDESSEIFISEINRDKSKDVSFDLTADADAVAGNYKIPVAVTYTLDNGNATPQSKTFLVSITINSKPNLILSSDSVILQGQQNKLDIQISNVGLSQAKFLNVQVGTSTKYSIISQDSVYIGDLASNDFNTASFNIYTNGFGSISVPVTLTYKDASNKDYAETKYLDVKAYTQSEAIQLGLVQQSNTGLYIGIVVVLIVAYIVYRVIRNRRSKKLNSS